MTELSKPVGLHVDGSLLYVGSFDRLLPAVYALDLHAPPGPKGKRVVRTFEHPTMLHPTGMLVHKRMLYVLDQSMNGLLKLDAIGSARPTRAPCWPTCPTLQRRSYWCQTADGVYFSLNEIK